MHNRWLNHRHNPLIQVHLQMTLLMGDKLWCRISLFNTNMLTHTLHLNMILVSSLKTSISDHLSKINIYLTIWTSKCSMLLREDHQLWIQTTRYRIIKLQLNHRRNLHNILWLSQIKVIIKERCKMEKGKVLEPVTGKTSLCMKVNGSMVSDRATENS